MDIPEFLWYGEKNTKGGTVMKELTAILAFLLLLTSCGQSQDSSDSPPMTSADNTTISAEEKEIGAEVITTTSTALTVTTTSISVTQPTTAVTQETTAVSVTEPVSTAETAETHSEEQSTPDTAQAAETPQTAVSEVITTAPTTTTKAVQQTVPTTAVTEPPTEPPPEAVTESPAEPKTVLSNDGTDYGKAKAVYDCMIENGHGTCVNYACQTYELCCDNGLQCYLVWTGAGLCGHVANIVNVDDVWYVLDTEGGFFLDYNYCFTEVVDIDGNHIADSDIISSYSYNELH